MVDARRIRFPLALLGAVLLLGVPSALGQTLYDRQADVDRRISGLREDIEAAKAKEGVLTSEIRAAGERIEALSGDIGALSGLIAELEAELAVYRARLARLEDRFEEQTRDLEHLKRQYTLAQRQLEGRLVELYQSEETDSFGVLLQVQSLGDLIDQLEYFDSIGRQDRAITAEIHRLKGEMRIARAETRLTKIEVGKATDALAAKTAEQVAAREALVAQQNAMAAARADRQDMLAGVREHRHEAEEDLDALQAASAQIAAQIQAAQAASSSSGGGGGGGGGSSGSGTSSSGFIWPVNGVVTSGFGWRWGRMHEGIDISAPAGTPIHAVASGTVIFAGWMGGYGNLVIVDHGNGLATAYAHQSAIYVGGGSVSQGQTLGAVGCTGSCTGNHLHFEVRVNGGAVDPMGYL
ncbi:MAG TPA: peptidoglycan DD-metalloendopeptidase family protein [Gaiellaceae bacterium]|nr:peptidoglycan DD-metalloendopeptidase family protein [Gaiellaceae bacterium]